MKKCAYYITGHGYGHATRSFTVIRKLLELGFSVIIVSSLNNEFVYQNNNFAEYANDKSKFSFEYRKLDAGAKQLGPLLIDLPETLNTYYRDICSHHDELVNYEVSFLKKNEIQLLLCDATPLACIAGKLANAKVIMLTNLTWDFLYHEMISDVKSNSSSLNTVTATSSSAASHVFNQFYENYDQLVKQIISDYSHADYYFQLPGPIPSLFPTTETSAKIIKCPLICRTHQVSKHAILKMYNIPENTYLLLLSFGGHDLNEFQLKDEYLPPRWVCLLLGK